MIIITIYNISSGVGIIPDSIPTNTVRWEQWSIIPREKSEAVSYRMNPRSPRIGRQRVGGRVSLELACSNNIRLSPLLPTTRLNSRPTRSSSVNLPALSTDWLPVNSSQLMLIWSPALHHPTFGPVSHLQVHNWQQQCGVFSRSRPGFASIAIGRIIRVL